MAAEDEVFLLIAEQYADQSIPLHEARIWLMQQIGGEPQVKAWEAEMGIAMRRMAQTRVSPEEFEALGRQIAVLQAGITGMWSELDKELIRLLQAWGFIAFGVRASPDQLSPGYEPVPPSRWFHLKLDGDDASATHERITYRHLRIARLALTLDEEEDAKRDWMVEVDADGSWRPASESLETSKDPEPKTFFGTPMWPVADTSGSVSERQLNQASIAEPPALVPTDMDDETLLAVLEEATRRLIDTDNFLMKLPGKGTFIPLIRRKMLRRAELGEILPTLGAEADWLENWMKSKANGHDAPGSKAIENARRETYRSVKA